MTFAKLLVCCVIVVYASSTFLEHDPGAIVKVYVYGWAQLCVYGDPKLGRHSGKVEYVCGGLLIDFFRKVTFKVQGVVIFLVPSVCVCPELLSCITELDVSDNIFVHNGDYG